MKKHFKHPQLSRKYFLTGCLLLIVSFGASAQHAKDNSTSPNQEYTQQGITVKGTVKDQTGETIIGANVLVKGTTNGIITDFDGQFVLENVPEGAIIEISFVGYLPQEVKASSTPLILF